MTGFIPDDDGNQYLLGYAALIRAHESTTSIVIKRQATYIAGVGETNNAFADCRTKLLSFSIESGSLLETIQPYAFFSCSQIKVADFSQCTHLTEINDYAFSGCYNLVSLRFPPSIIRLGKHTFRSSKINVVNFPASLEVIDQYTFAQNSNLELITFEAESSIVIIGDGAFDLCNKLTNFTIPKKFASFNGVAFLSSKNVRKIFVEEGNTKYTIINDVVFADQNKTLAYYPPALNSIFEVPNFVNNIQSYCFVSAPVTSIILPESILTIGTCAFRATSISSIIIPSKVTSMGIWTFYSCNKLKNITFKCKVSTLSGTMFSYCGFESFDIPDGVVSVGGDCFRGCSKLQLVTLPSSLTTLGGGVFRGCHPNLSIKFRDSANLVIDDQQMILNKALSEVSMYLGSQAVVTLNIPSSVQTILSGAFSGKTNIVGISIPSNSLLKVISLNAFLGCTNLKTFSFAPNLEVIGESAFMSCSNLKMFSFGTKIKSITLRSFAFCTSLTNISMLPSIYKFEIGKKAFEGCSNLKYLTFQDGLSIIGELSFFKCQQLQTLLLPKSISFIGENAFQYSGIEEVVFPDDCLLQSLDPYSFHESNLKNITLNSFHFIKRYSLSSTLIRVFNLPPSVETLEESCFKGCSSLEIFNIPQFSSLHSIEYGVFEGCKSFRMINCHEGNNFTVENFALFNKQRTNLIVLPPASAVRFFYLPSSVSCIQQASFLGCNHLEGIIIPEESVRKVEARAFLNCTNLHFINIPKSINSFGVDCFFGCTKLKCGVTVDNFTTDFLNMLFSVGLPKSAIKECKPDNTCKPKHTSRISRSFLFAFVFISSN